MIIKRIYTDIDGVIVNMIEGYHQAFGVYPPEDHEDFYSRTKKTPGFWENLPWRKDAIEYWMFLKRYCKGTGVELWILTANPKDDLDNTFYAGRKKWILDNLGSEYLERTIIEYDKYKYADKYSLLIDDRRRNTEAWEKHTGLAILYEDFFRFKKKFDELINERSPK